MKIRKKVKKQFYKIFTNYNALMISFLSNLIKYNNYIKMI